MKKTGFLLGVFWLICNPVWGHEDHGGGKDEIGGVPLADFSVDELRIPCVEVRNLSESTEGTFYDVILRRRGSSFNFELEHAAPEDTALCQTLANIAKFEDDDFDAGTAEDPEDGSGGAGGGEVILVTCEKRQTRSKISVKAKHLSPSDYSATVSSGDNTAGTALQSAVGDEAEFDFDSQMDDISEGATEISPDFIQDDTVSANLLDGEGNVVASTESVACLNK